VKIEKVVIVGFCSSTQLTPTPLAVKNIGKSRHGGRKSHARFDEGGLAKDG
jgi:hypothetical protein